MIKTNQLFDINSDCINQASLILNQLFANYPLHIGFFPKDSQRERKSRIFLEFALRYSIKFGIAQAISPRFEGIALWLPPSKKNFEFSKTLRSGTFAGWVQLSKDFLLHVLPIANHLESIRLHVIREPHWYLLYIGVECEYQGKGYSTKLINHMLEKIDTSKKYCYLETHTEKNVQIFQRFGFQVADVSRIPTTDITNWAMLRPPKQ